MNKNCLQSLAPEYFDDVYAASEDPWNFAQSEYEAAKYGATLTALPRARYRAAFEIGCSIGVLTEQLAARCDRLLAVDVTDKALVQARRRCRHLPQVEFKKMQIPGEFPVETFDLILVSEVGYYLSPADWAAAANLIVEHLAPGGDVILVHWTPFVDDYPQTGDQVHDSFNRLTRPSLVHSTHEPAEKYRLDAWRKRSAADQQEERQQRAAAPDERATPPERV